MSGPRSEAVILRPPIGVAVWKIAQLEAAALYHEFLGTEHVLMALSRTEGGYTERLLARLKANPNPKYLRAELRGRAGIGSARFFSGGDPIPTPRLRAALAAAQVEAGEQGLGERELLLAVLRGGPGLAVRLLTREGTAIETLIGWVEADEGPEASGVRMPQHDDHGDEEERRPPRRSASGGDTPTLDRYCRDLTAAAREGKLRPVVGRQHEIVAIGQALVRADQNVPVLVGEAGVGKTAIVEAFALRLAREHERPVVEALRGKRILELRPTSLVAGAKYRGDFEERAEAILAECAAHPEIILFIDEMHTLVGAGGSDGTQDLSQILKPALANGELRVIGATTPAEYERHLAKDAALERRLQPIRIEEPSTAETEDLLREVKGRYEARHGVLIQPEALVAAVELSVRYLPDRRLPAKALSLLDDACARVVVGSQLSVGYVEVPAGGGGGVVTAETVAEAVADRLGVPATAITERDQERVLSLERTLKRRVVAQDEAIHGVAEAMKVAFSTFRDPARPRSVLLFAGPTGVGKTETVRALAEALFAGRLDQHLLTLDMAELSQEHMVSLLIGAPPGYKGYEEEGKLTGWLRRHPYSVVLFDEIEKAHPAVRKLLLGLFEVGRLSDAQGRTINGREAVYVLTTNLLADGDELLSQPAEAPAGGPRSPRERLAVELTPELVNRLDRVIVFRPLDAVALDDIVQLRINDVRQRLDQRGVGLVVDGAVRQWLIERGTDRASGARELSRLIQSALVAPLADLELRGQLSPGVTVHVALDDDNHLAFDARPTAQG